MNVTTHAAWRAAPLVLLALLLNLASAGPTDTFNSTYAASSGALPDQVCPPWSLVDTASPEDPFLSGGNLIVSTSANTENIFYIQRGPEIAVPLPDPLIIEARIRLVSGSSSHAARAPIGILCTTSPTVGNFLSIGADEIFLQAGHLTKGDRAFVDTNDAFHTYRIEVSGTGAIQVFYDDVLTLTGSTFSSIDDNGSTERVAWGEYSYLATGTSEWEFVRHNASAIRCVKVVQIDIKPGSDPNSVNLGAHASVPVAIFSTLTFDATQVDPTTVTLADAGVKVRGKGMAMAVPEDVNGDGLLDLVIHVDTEGLSLTSGDTEAVLEGQTLAGIPIRGVDSIRVIE